MHLPAICSFLYIFGDNVEDRSAWVLSCLYLLCGAGAALVQVYAQQNFMPHS